MIKALQHVQALSDIAHLWLDSLTNQLEKLIEADSALQLGEHLLSAASGPPTAESWSFPKAPGGTWTVEKHATVHTVLASFNDIRSAPDFDLASACLSFDTVVALACTHLAVQHSWFFPDMSTKQVLSWGGVKGEEYSAASKDAKEKGLAPLHPNLASCMRSVAKAEVCRHMPMLCMVCHL